MQPLKNFRRAAIVTPPQWSSSCAVVYTTEVITDGGERTVASGVTVTSVAFSGVITHQFQRTQKESVHHVGAVSRNVTVSPSLG